MINQSDFQKIKNVAQEFFKKTNLPIEVEVKNPQDLTVPVELKMEEPQILIGEGGQTLIELQHLLKLVFKKGINAQGPFYVDLDINNYKKKKIEYLKEMARTVADEVSLVKKEKQLPPMPAYERRIIHLELAAREDIVSESMDVESGRRVVIRPHL